MATSITVQTDSALDRITWTFSADRTTGTFANGEPWVVGPVTIIDIFPKPTDTPDIRRTTSLKHGQIVLQTVAQSKNVSDGLDWPFGPLQNSSNTVGGVGDVWHGSMINPEINSAYSSSGFDTRIFSSEVADASNRRTKSGLYKHTLNAALSVCVGGPNNGAGFTLQPGDVLWSARSFVSTNPGDSGQTGTYGAACLQKIAVLTVLSVAPPAGSFRPSIWGTDRTINWNIDDIDWDVFKSLTLPPAAGADTTADFTYAQMLTMMPSLPWIEWAGHALASFWGPWQNNRHIIEFKNTSRYSVPSNDDYPNGSWFSNDEAAAARGESYNIRDPLGITVEGGTYGQPTAVKFGSIALWLNTGPLTDEKKTIAYRYIQNGLDIFDWLFKYNTDTGEWSRRGHTSFYPDGGHRQGRKLPVVVAAACLGAKTGAATAKLKYAASEWKAVDETLSYEGFSEDATTFTVKTNDLIRYMDPLTTGSWKGLPFERYNKSWLGKADWGIKHSYRSKDDNAYSNSTYRSNQQMEIAWLACRIMGLTTLWNHDAGTVLYFERHHSPAAGAQLSAYTDTGSFMYARMMPAYFSLFFIGRKIVTNKVTAVRGAANSGSSTSFLANKVGTIIAGPVLVGTVNWWQIRYKNGSTLATQLTGWSPETDINVLGSGFNTTIDGRGGIFELGKEISLTTSVPDASVYYTTSTPGDTILTVTNSGTGAYVINGASNPTLSFVRGRRYIININALGHPFWIQTVPGARSIDAVYNTGITDNGIDDGTITIDVPYDAPQLYYVCGNHSSMAGSITVSDSTPADYDPSSGVAKLNAGGTIGTASYPLPAGDTVFTTAIVREGYDMSDVTSATYRIDSSGVPVQPSQSRGVASATQPEPALIFPPTATLTQYGITWTFAPELALGQYGQFVNGDWWVVGPVTITNINPKTVSGGDPINGTMLNPIPNEIQGLCNRVPGEVPVYAPDKNISLQLPYAIDPGNSVYSTMDNPDTWLNTYPGQLEKTYFKETAVLTVLSEAPPEGSFRPPYAGTAKTIKSNWNESSMNYAVLRKLAAPIPANVPNREWMEDATKRPLLELNRNYLNSQWKASWAETKTGGYPRRTYGREIAHISGGAGLYLQTDVSDATKRRLLINMCQWGIDIYGLLGAGMQWQANGDHQQGRLLPLYIAAKVLGDAEMLVKCSGTTVAERTAFQEYGQHFIVDQSDVDTPRSYSFALPYTTEMIGMAEWSSNAIWERAQANANFYEPDYRWQCGAPNCGIAATILLMGGRAEVAAEPFLRYIIERHYPATRANAQLTLPDYGDSPTLFTRDMLDAYVNIDTGLPPGLTIDTVTGVISGTPTTAGEYLITLAATNATGTSTSPLTITISSADPASWSYRAWTNDETSGITGTSVYTAAVNLGGGAITVNGVPFEAGTGRTNFSIGGDVSTMSDVTKVTGASAILAGSFIYGGKPRTITLTGLTPGMRYETSLFSTGWEAAGRVQVFTDGINTLTLDQDAYGKDNGICIQYTFVAAATTQQLTITPVTDSITFHLAALANRRI